MAWWGLRSVTGFCFAGLYLVIESWLNERAANEQRGMVMGVYTMINLSVIVAGQMMLTLGDPSSFLLFAYASILVSLAAVTLNVLAWGTVLGATTDARPGDAGGCRGTG